MLRLEDMSEKVVNYLKLPEHFVYIVGQYPFERNIFWPEILNR